MPEYIKARVIYGHDDGFEQAFGEALAPAPPDGPLQLFGSTYLGRVTLSSVQGGVRLPRWLIGKKVYYTHCLGKSAHVSHL